MDWAGRKLLLMVSAMVLAIFGIGCSAAAAQSVSNGYRILRERGLQIEANVYVNAAPAPFDFARWGQSNFTTLNLDYAVEPDDLGTPPGVSWARWASDNESGLGDTRRLRNDELPYLSKLVSLQYEDEKSIADSSFRSEVSAWIADVRPRYPNVILRTDEWGYQNTEAELRTYAQSVRPDMLMFFYYPFNGNIEGGSPTLLYGAMAKYRRVALEGHDGTGSLPIPYGLYTQTLVADGFHIASESELRLNHFAAWTFGYTTTSAFNYNDNTHLGGTVDSILFNGAGYSNPTASFFQVAEINRQGRMLGPSLVRLHSVDVRVVPGQHRFTIFSLPNDVPSGTSAWAPGTVAVDPFATAVSAVNLGTRNNGLRGDVWLGYFHPMLEADDGPAFNNELYFMVQNGLTDESGSAADTRQRIRIDYDFGTSGITSLLRLSRTTGVVETVPLVHDGGSLYHLDLILDGGTADLFKFNTGAPFIVPEPTTSSLGTIGAVLSVFVLCRYRRPSSR